jgi:meso-butanediol dehydrogenase / (S,S)-butanediol dehydrogenase / diacetyl reductase
MTMQFDYRDKKVLVTDSTSGLGRRVAESFHSLGAIVAINGPSADSVLRAIQEMGGDTRLVGAAGDLTKSAEIRPTVDAAVEAMKGLDVLICSTARGDLCRLDDITPEYWEEVLAVNLKVAFFTAQACAPALKKSKGCIVNVASAIGLIAGPPGAVVYSTAKGAMVHMSRMMALELASHGVRVNTFCPGWIDPPVARPGIEPDSNGALDVYIAQRSPLQRTATLEECADAILYLAAGVASYTTGATLVADGGLTSGHYLS